MVAPVWYEAGAPARASWRGSAEQTASGERLYFDDLPALMIFITAQAQRAQAPSAPEVEWLL